VLAICWPPSATNPIRRGTPAGAVFVYANGTRVFVILGGRPRVRRLIIVEDGQSPKRLSDRFWEWNESVSRRSGFAPIGNKRFSLWLSAFGDSHLIKGSALQGLLFGVALLPFYLVLTGLHDPTFALVVCGCSGVAFGVFMYFLHRWRRRTGRRAYDLENRCESK
jgi:hypothetical protein